MEEEECIEYPDWDAEEANGFVGDHVAVQSTETPKPEVPNGTVGDHVAVRSSEAPKPKKGYLDSVTGDELPSRFVDAARKEEIGFMQEWGGRRIEALV